MHSSPEMCHAFTIISWPRHTANKMVLFLTSFSPISGIGRKNEMEILWKTTWRCIRLKCISGHGHGHSHGHGHGPRRETLPRTCSNFPSVHRPAPAPQLPLRMKTSLSHSQPANLIPPRHEVISISISCAKSPTLTSPLSVSGAEISPNCSLTMRALLEVSQASPIALRVSLVSSL